MDKARKPAEMALNSLPSDRRKRRFREAGRHDAASMRNGENHKVTGYLPWLSR
jgi:hypothetical protein